MRLDEIRQSAPAELRDAFSDFKLELEGAMGWEVEWVDRTSDSVQIKAYWFDEDGRTAAPIREVKRLAREYFLNYDLPVSLIDEQEHHSLYQIILGW